VSILLSFVLLEELVSVLVPEPGLGRVLAPGLALVPGPELALELVLGLVSVPGSQ
jgi:hypothetical protein